MALSYPISDEMADVGLAFRDEFVTESKTTGQGGVIAGTYSFGSTGISLGTDGVVTYRTPDRMVYDTTAITVLVRLVIDNNWATDGTQRLILVQGANLIIEKDAGNNLVVTVGGTGSVSADVSGWGAGEHTIVVQVKGNALSLYLDGGAATQDTTVTYPTWGASFTVGAAANGPNTVVRSVQLFVMTINATEAVDLFNRATISKLAAEKAVCVIPCKTVTAPGGVSQTPIVGQTKDLTCLLGPDGTTSTGFPTLITPRGFSYDGGDQLTIADDSRFTFGDGSTDSPFSLACLVRLDPSCTTINQGLIGKGSFGANEWHIQTVRYAPGNVRILFSLRNAGQDGICQVYSNFINSLIPSYFSIIATYNGNSLNTGMELYIDGADFVGIRFSYVYDFMSDLGGPFTVGKGLSPFLLGDLGSPMIFDFELTPMQVRALSRRLLRLRHTS